jgi:hypothetical protein
MAGFAQVSKPELFQWRPLRAIVEEIGAEDNVELLVELCVAPIKAARAEDVSGATGWPAVAMFEREQAIQSGEEQSIGVQIGHEDAMPQGDRGGAGGAEAAAQVQHVQ